MDDQMGGPQWTPADELLYADVQKGLGQVRKDLFDGEVHPDHAAPVLQELTQKAAALDQRRKQADDQAMGEQFHKAAHAAAMQQSLLQANAADTARGFPSAVGEDPVTGQRFAPPGWQQIDRPEADPNAAFSGGEPLDTSGALPETQPQVQQNPDGTQQMTIWNGAHRTEATFGPDGKLIGQQMYGPDNQPIAPQLAQASQQFGVPPDVMQRIQGQAFQLFPGRDVHSATSRGHFINRGISAYHTNALVEKRAQLQAQKLQQDEHDKNFDTVLRQEKKDVAADWRKAHPNEEMTGDTRQKLNEDALKNAHDHFNSTYGKPHRGGYQAGQTAPVGGPTEAPKEPEPPIATARRIFTAQKLGTPHDFNTMVTEHEAKLKDETLPTQETGGVTDPQTGNTYFAPGKWSDLPKDVRHRIVDQQIVERVERLSGKKIARPIQQASAPAATADATPTTPPAPTDADEAKKNLEKIAESEAKRAKSKAERERRQPQAPLFIPLS